MNPLVETASFLFSSELGNIVASYSNEALIQLQFEHNTVIQASDCGDPFPLHEELKRQLNAYFKGNANSFDIAMAPQGTTFQQEIWSLLRDIPYGRTVSYQELSEQYGDPKAIRAIASANGANPIMIITPCHRVIGSTGSLTGYAGGLWRKEALLDLEQGVKRLF